MDASDTPFWLALLLKHFWLILIGGSFLSVLVMKVRTRKYVEQNPILLEGYEKLFRGFILYLNLPWIIMGIGMIFGDFPTIFDFMTAAEKGNLFSLVFYGTIGVLLFLGVVWIYFRGGAELLVDHPGLLNWNIQSPLMIKILFAILLAGCIYGFISLINIKF
jgi:hypothetical protein